MKRKRSFNEWWRKCVFDAAIHQVNLAQFNGIKRMCARAYRAGLLAAAGICDERAKVATSASGIIWCDNLAHTIRAVAEEAGK